VATSNTVFTIELALARGGFAGTCERAAQEIAALERARRPPVHIVAPRYASCKLRKLLTRAERAWRYSDESKAGADGWLRRCRKAGWEYLNPGVWAPWKGTDTRRMEGDQ
jgi:hypothetical protein